MLLKLKKMGAQIKEEDRIKKGTDIINYRVRAEFTDEKNRDVVVDFMGYDSRDKKGKILRHNALAIDGGFYDLKGICRDYAYHLNAEGYNLNKYDFTKSGILNFVNAVTGGCYNSIKYI